VNTFFTLATNRTKNFKQ
jgi:hypothetical protein